MFQPWLQEPNPVYIYNIEDKSLMSIGDFYQGFVATWSPDSQRLAICYYGLHIIAMSTYQIENIDEPCTPPILVWRDNNAIIVGQHDGIYSIPVP